MAERQAVLGQQRLGLGAAQAGLERCGHGDGVDGDQTVEAAEVEADQAGVPVAAGGQTARHAGAAAERHDRDVVLDRHREHARPPRRGSPGARPRRGRRPGRLRGRAAGRAWTCRACAAGGASSSVRTWPSPTTSAKAASTSAAGRRRQLAGHGLDLAGGPEHRLDERPGAVGQRGGSGGVAPALRVHLSRHALQCDI